MATALGAGELVDDPNLVRRARDGDTEAYDVLFRRHREAVARTAFLLLRDRETAQDTAQEAFLIGWSRIQRLKDLALFRAWVTGIAVNVCRRQHRRALRDRDRANLQAAVARVPGYDDVDLRLSVRHALGELPRPMREVVVLRFYGGFTEQEMAAALGVPAGTVKSRLSRARERLAAVLEPLMEVE